MNTKLWNMIDKKFRHSDIRGAVSSLEKKLSKEPTDSFKGLIGKEFSNSPLSILTEINKFIRAWDRSFDIKAVYLEMNGFDINYDRWYFDLFGYDRYEENPMDLEWLCKWQSEDWKQIRLIGLESIQKEFE